ncbi:hypothetical protein NA57DRAFT_57918 [Rhizodiscina lignyota]|uniref:ATP-dependent RNA helicase n=1 Tax=Rhizodiscina lignyota TaxID=1504668 RepID=A0A9P4I8V3_9PEZI|nr:hypothetical protein NA57DRAFT_57918 [Rhizodiscina lignyota]
MLLAGYKIFSSYLLSPLLFFLSSQKTWRTQTTLKEIQTHWRINSPSTNIKVGNLADEQRLRALIGGGQNVPLAPIRARHAPTALPTSYRAAMVPILYNMHQLNLIPAFDDPNGITNQILRDVENGITLHRFHNAASSIEKCYTTILCAVHAVAKDLTEGSNSGQTNGVQTGPPPPRRPRCVTFVSTRGSAVDMYNWALNLCYGTGLRPGVVYGTWSPTNACLSYTEQLHELDRYDCDILIGPPTRLLHLSQNHYPLNGLRLLCMDQAQAFANDRWYDDLYEPLQRMRLIRDETSVLAVGSTQFNIHDARALATYLRTSNRLVTFSCTQGTDAIHTSELVRQELDIQYGPIAWERCVDKIRDILNEEGKALVYLNTREAADTFFHALLPELRQRGVNLNGALARVGVYHAHREQRDNEKVLHDFTYGSDLKVLIGTQILAELRHDPNITDIIHIGLPHDSVQYLSRIGSVARINTGNAQDQPKSTAFVMTRKDAPSFDQVAGVVSRRGEHTVDEIMRMLQHRPIAQQIQRARNGTHNLDTYNHKTTPDCYGCHQPGHVRYLCPNTRSRS